MLAQSYRCPLSLQASISKTLPAIIDSGHTFSYSQLDCLTEKKTYQLHKKGLCSSKLFYLSAEYSVETLITFFALLRLHIPFKLMSPYQLDSNAKLSTLSDVLFQNKRCIFFETSGSTGIPKNVIHSIDTLAKSAAASIQYYSMQQSDTFLASLPFFHVGGIMTMLRSVLCGGTLVMTDYRNLSSTFLNDFGIHFLSVVPTQLKRLLMSNQSIKTVKTMLVGGASCPKKLLHDAKKQGIVTSYTYGLTEMGSQVTAGNLTAGKPLSGKKVMISNKDEILVQGESMFHGYYQSGKVIQNLTADGFYATKDLGYFDDNGNLVVTGRKDRMMIKGGENIHPEMIERALLEHPDIIEAVVVPMQSAEYGQEPVALVKTSKETPEEVLLSYLLDLLPSFFCPKHILKLPPKKTLKYASNELIQYASHALLGNDSRAT